MQKGPKGRGASSGSSGTGLKSPVDVRGSERVRSTRKSAARGEPMEDDARRALADSSKLYYRIGEVSELTGVKAHVLRYWETEFRWMAPPKSRSKQRLYRKRDIEFVWLLKKLLWEQRYTIAGARQRIQELGLEEALVRSADAEALEPLGASLTDAVRDRSGALSGQSDVPESGGWLGVRVALETMQAELLALRGALQQGL